MKARIKFRKYGILRFIGHLDVMRYFQKVMRRAEIPIAFTGGFSPHMVMSFASPLGIGLESDGEYLDVELSAPVESAEAVRRMNEAGVEGIEVLSFRQIADEKKMTGMTILAAADYLIAPGDAPHAAGAIPWDWKEKFASFLGQEEIRVRKQTKRSEREVDIRPLVFSWKSVPEGIVVRLAAGSSENLKPELLMDTFVRTWPEPDKGKALHGPVFSFRRLELYAFLSEKGQEGGFVTLESLGHDITT